MSVNQLISSRLANITFVPKRKRTSARKKKANTKKTKQHVIDLTASKEDSDFLKDLDVVSPGYWTSILNHAPLKQENLSSNTASEYSDTSDISGSNNLLFPTLAIGE